MFDSGMTTYSANAPLAVYADNLYVLANVCLAGAALQALATGHMHLSGDGVAFLDASDLAANRFDHTAEFVTRYQWRMNAPLRPLVPVVDVKVGTTDGSNFDFDENVCGAEFGFRYLADFAARRRCGLDYGKHGVGHEELFSPNCGGDTSAQYPAPAVSKIMILARALLATAV